MLTPHDMQIKSTRAMHHTEKTCKMEVVFFPST